MNKCGLFIYIWDIIGNNKNRMKHNSATTWVDLKHVPSKQARPPESLYDPFIGETQK